MNKAYLIIFVLSLTTISSCDKTGIANNIYEDKLINQTNKELFFTSYFDVRKDSSLCNPYDSVSLVFIKKVNYSIPFIGPYYVDEGEYPKQVLSIIYNLTDTTIYNKNEISAINNSLKVDSFILSTRKIIQVKYVTDDFITSFKKDYSMLEKFNEYYQK